MSESICLQCENKRICKTGIHQPSANVTVNGCSRFEQKEKQTNADRIRAMTDEELAVVIAWPYLASPPWCSEHTTCPYISEDPTPCDKCALDWLKQEVTTNSTT